MKKAKKVIAIMLTVLTIIGMCSVATTVFAAEHVGNAGIVSSDTEELFGNVKGSVNDEDLGNDNVNILSEVVEKRDENEKHFALSDGSFMVAQYDKPVHYRDNEGNWVDYENTLNEKDANDEELLLFGDKKVIKTNNDSTNVVFARKSNSNTLVSYESDGYPISFNYKSAKMSRARIDENVGKNTGNDYYLNLSNVASSITYEDVFNGIDIQYIVTSADIKENIILESSNAYAPITANYSIGNLTAVIVEENKIDLVDGSNLVYSITAPYMYDANGTVCENVSFSVIKNKNGKLQFDILADEEWLNSEERRYPVVIDPTIITKTTKSAVDSTFISSGSSYADKNLSDRLEMLVGRESSAYNYCNTLIKTDLPQLKKGDIVVDAELYVYQYDIDYYVENMPPLQVNAHKILSDWAVNTVTWDTKPDYSSIASDYAKLSNSTTGTKVSFNISRIVKSWYEDPNSNFGVLLRSANESGAYAENGIKASIWTERYNDQTDAYPVLTITYRNNKGLEDYWTYTTLSAGTAGTAYINDYTGNLVFVHGDIQTTGEILPISLEHVYNGYMAGSNSGKYPHAGRGFKLSLQQTVKTSDAYGLSGNALNKFPYAYEDSDGTVHFFFKETGSNGSVKYIDEDGLNLELKTTSDGGYTITDKAGNVKTFNHLGNLKYIDDADGNRATLTYTKDENYYGDEVYYLKTIEDGAGHVITLTYSSGTDNSSQLSKITGPDGRSINYGVSSGRVTTITYPDSTSSKYTYNSDGQMLTAESADGYKLTFTYANDGSGAVASVTESSGSATGQKITFDRSKMNQTVFQTSGRDAVFGNSNDVITTYQFDNYGKTVSTKAATVEGTGLGASAYDYTKAANEDSYTFANRIKSLGSMGKIVPNILSDSSAEEGSGWNDYHWISSNYTSGSGTFSSSAKYIGQKSVKISVSEATAEGGYMMFQDVTDYVTNGSTYTFSAYVKTSGVTLRSGSSVVGGACLAMRIVTADGTERTYSKALTGSTPSDIDNGWQRLSMTFKVPSDATSVRVVLLLRNATGTAYFDCMQLEKSDMANSYNLLSNSSFELGTSNGWVLKNLTDSDKVQSSNSMGGSYGFKIVGDADTEKFLYQSVYVGGNEEDTYIFGGWAKASAAISTDSAIRFDISLKIIYTDGTTVNKRPVFEFNRGVRDWQFGSCVFNLSDNDDTQNRTPEKINVYINYRKQVNTAYFDNFSLIKEPVPTYEYDEDGNLVSAVQNAENKSALTYDSNNNLSSFTDEREAQYSYTYNTSGNKHQLKTATSNFTGLKYSYTYNDTGSVKSQTVNNSNASSAIATDFEYTAASGDIKAGAYLLKETNQRGFSTTYDYNLNNGQLNSVTMANDQVVSYAYKPNTNLLSSVIHSPKTISYTYDSTNTKLSAVNWNGFNYNFVYDVFGNLKQTKIGSTPLETNTYQSYNGKLAITTYGNGDYTSWHYNDLGLVTKVLKNDVTKYQWLYNSAGEAGIQYDFENDETHNYVFDSLGRLVRKIVDKKSTGENKYISQQTYDLSGNVTKITNAAKGLQVSASYEYDKENRPTKTTLSDCASFNYSYDSLNRLTGKSMEDTDMGITYGYLSSVRNVGTDSSLYKTNFLRTETIAGKTYRYNYDNLGRIITVYEQEPTKSEEYKIGYVPDRFGQIVRENNAHLNKSITYSYDSYGNLTHKKYYPFTTSTLGTVEKTVAYTYDSTWKDKLISYDGQTITYDSIGNPLTYRDSMSFTWDGREMKTANINGTAVTYRYNSDGLRSYKKVGSTEHEYQYLEDKLVYEKNGNLQFHYRYDAFGNLAEIRRVNADGSVNMACAVCNSFGDVIELRYRSGGLYATYKYDTWGKLLGVYDASGNAITSIYSLATQNPFRYRGYYYDTESGLYYLNGRYYDPVVCRFISPDSVSVATASLSSYYNKNLYAYCDNNPVIRKDTTGAYWESAFDAVSLGLSIAEVAANPSDLWAWAGLAGDFFDVVAPCIGGVGEAVRVAKASMKGADAAVDAVSAAKKADNAVDGVKSLKITTNISTKELIPTHRLTHGQNKMNSLIKDIKKNGIKTPLNYVTFNGKNYVVDGHHRLAAAKRLGFEQVPAKPVGLPFRGYKTPTDFFDWGY